MSYDVTLTGFFMGADHVSRNMTSNLAPMWKRAGADVARFHGRRAGQLVAMLKSAIAAMERDPDTYRELNPPNGWGDYESCLLFLRELLQDFNEHPQAIVHVDH